MSRRLFMSKTDRYDDDMRAADSLRACPVWLMNPNGEQEPGVGLFEGTRPRFMMPLTDALRVANQIADIIQDHKENQ